MRVERRPSAPETYELQFVFLHSTAIKSDFNLHNCIRYGFRRLGVFSWIFRKDDKLLKTQHGAQFAIKLHANA